MIDLAALLPDAAGLRALRNALMVTACLAANGCASLKKMTEDFEKKWDDPETILAEMDETAKSNRAVDSSADAMAAFNSNDCAKQFRLLERNAAGDADFADRQLSAAECMLGEGKNEDAAKLFALITDDDAANALAHQGRGVALVRLGRFDEASVSLQSALDLDGGLWRAWNAKGVADDHRGQQEDAWTAYRKAAELNPEDGAAWNNLGVSLVKAERRQEAIDAFKQSLAVDGAREAAEANLRMTYAMEGDYSSAVKAISDDKRPIALNNAGVAAAARGETSEAKRLFARALDESPHFYAKAYNNLSLLVE